MMIMEEREMKRVSEIVVFISLLIPYTFCQAQDSTSIKISDKYKFVVSAIPFGMQAQASMDDETQIEVKPLVGAGLSYYIVRKDIFGVGLNTLVYTNEDKVMYPLLGGGITLFPQNKSAIAISLAWDFGKIAGKLDKSWKERLKVLFNYNINFWEK